MPVYKELQIITGKGNNCGEFSAQSYPFTTVNVWRFFMKYQ